MTHPLAALIADVPRVKHKKRGSTYIVLGRAKIQTDAPLTDYADVVVYKGEADGMMWVRPVSEFEDGRFAALEAATPPDLVEAGRVLEQLAPYGKNGRGKDHPQSVACRNAADTIRALIALATAQAAQIAARDGECEAKAQIIAGLEAKVAEVTREGKPADHALVDKYRRGGTGIFKFPDDVAAIIRKLDAAEAEAATLRAENERLRGALDRIETAWPLVRDTDCTGGELASAIEEIDAALEGKHE